MALTFGFWQPETLEEALSYGKAKERDHAHLIRAIAPARRQALRSISASVKALNKTLTLLRRLDDAIPLIDHTTEEMHLRHERRMTEEKRERDRQLMPEMRNRMRAWERRARVEHPEFWDGDRSRGSWESRGARVQNALIELQKKLEFPPLTKPRLEARNHVIRILTEQGHAEGLIAQRLISLGLEKGPVPKALGRVRAHLNDQVKRKQRKKR